MQDLINNVERMTSIEIAEVTGKQHNNVLKAIRKMETAWEKITQGKFYLSDLADCFLNHELRTLRVSESNAKRV